MSVQLLGVLLSKYLIAFWSIESNRINYFVLCTPQQKFARVPANGLGVNVSNQDGFTPLHMAALHGHSDLVSLLLKHGASISAKNAEHAVPLHLACQKGHSQVMEPLIASYLTQRHQQKTLL